MKIKITKIEQIIDNLKEKASHRPVFENGVFNKDNANYQTGIEKALTELYNLLSR